MLPKKLISLLIACCSLFLYTQAAAAHPNMNRPVSETGLKPVQVFDVAAGKVLKTIPNDKEFQTFATSWTNSITGLAPQITTDPSCSFVFRVPLQKPVTLKANDISVTTDDVFLFYCKEKPPLLLVFDEKRKPFIFLFKTDITPFLQKVGLPAS
ncbi:hypothetical protein [Paenibacillus sp. sgz302251]|uniref:hypothetical protein n=1 Tax=Paenibacillus sp. sgz302251 TaxID=3414493 RepID=UPI003C7A8A8A